MAAPKLCTWFGADDVYADVIFAALETRLALLGQTTVLVERLRRLLPARYS